jgi:hypothetical protein
MEESARRTRNAVRLQECFPTFAARVSAVIADMEELGFRPRIQDAHRTIADQLIAFNKGNSMVKFGFHNVTGIGGKAESLGVDLLDDDAPVAGSRKYFITLASVAQKNGLHSGIFFGLKPKANRPALRLALQKAIDNLDFKPSVTIGFDPTHLEPTGLTIAEAEAGERPT